MGTTADKLNKLLNTKQAIKQAIVDKGVEVGDDTKFSDYPAKIESIVTEGADPYFEVLWNAITNNNTDYNYLFSDYNGASLDVSNFDTSNVTDMSYMFYYCKSLTSLDVSNFNTSNVTTMNYMFGNCEKLTTIDVSNFNTSNVTNMSQMFQYCNKLTSLDVSNFNTSNVTNMNNMFYYCEKLTSLDVSNFDLSKITSDYNFNIAFNYCKSLVDFYPPKNIGVSMNVGNSTVLSHDSLIRIIDNLKTVTSTKTLTLGTTNLAKLTADEIAIATNKGWTVK